MLTPRVSRLEEPSPTLTQPLMFFVTAWARSARPQALTTRWLAPDATRSREHSSEAALTLTARTALAPNGLRTTLHATQNTYRRIRNARSFTLVLGTTRSVVHAKLVMPRTRSLARFAATPRQGHLGSVRAMPSPTRAFRQTSPLDQRYVRSTTAIPHVKNEHSLFRAVTESLARVAPGALR